MAEETKKVLLDISVNADQFINKIATAKDRIDALKTSNKQLATEAKAALEKGLFEEYDKLTKQIIVNENALKVARTEMSRNQRQFESYTLAAKANAGSYEQVYQQWKLADATLKNLEGTLKRNADGTIQLTEEYKRAKVETENAKNALLQFGEGIKDGRLNVGNYAASVEQVISKLPVFGGGLELVKSGLGGVKEGLELVREGTRIFNEGMTQALTAVGSIPTTISSSFKNSVSSIKEWTSSIKGSKEAADDLNPGEVAGNVTQVGVAGRLAATGLNVGTGALKLFRLALISTGIGALVVAVGALITFFTKTKDGADKLEVAFGAIGGAVGSLIKTFGELGGVIFNAFSSPKKAVEDLFNAIANPGQTIRNLGNFFADAGKKAAAAASEMAKITREQQAQDDIARENLALNAESEGKIKAALAATKEVTKSDIERLNQLKLAGEEEQKMAARKTQEAEKAIELLQREIAVKGINGQSEQRLAELQAERVKVLADSSVLQAQIRVRESKFERDLLNEKLSAERQIAEARIKSAELRGQDTTSLRIAAARLERDQLLNEENLTAQQIQAIRIDYNNKLLEIDRDGAQRRQALADSLQDAQIDSILDGQTREIEAEKVAFERKLRDIKGFSDQENALREQLAENSALKILEITSKYEKQNLDEKNEALKTATDQQIAQLNQAEADRLRALEVSSAKELGLLELKVEQGTATEQQLKDRQAEIEAEKYLIVEESLIKELELRTRFAAQRKLNEETFFIEESQRLNDLLANKKIDQETFDAAQAELLKNKTDNLARIEIESASSVNQATTALNEARANNEIATNKRIIDDKKKRLAAEKAIEQEIKNSYIAVSRDLTQFLTRDEASRKKSAKLVQALAIAEIGFNLEKEISGLFTGASVDTGKTGVYGGLPAYAIAAARAIQASIRVASAVSKIQSTTQALAEGGMTGNGKPMSFMSAVTQYQPSILSDFNGGMVSKPVMWNLAGEKGSEYVAPTWQLNQAPHIFAALEGWRRTGVRPFADGGFTQNQFAPVISQAENTQAAVSSALNSMTPIYVTVEDIKSVESRVSVLESRASI